MEAIAIPGVEIYYEKNFLSSEEATTLFNTLLAKCAWERRKSSFNSAVPRDEAYYGDPGTNYTYSRREYKPLPWIPDLLPLKSRVEESTPATAYANLKKLGYNAVLCNLYRNGNDSVGLHADAEPEMGPVISSVSLERKGYFDSRGRMDLWCLRNACRMAACSSWPEQPRKASSMKSQKNLSHNRASI